MEKGLLIVVSGPSGSGKGTVNKRLLQSEDFVFSVSATTRAPREGEVDGVNYHYITREDFECRIRNGEMLEYTTYCQNYYGTPLKEALAVLESGKNLLLEIEVEGALNVKRAYPEAVLIMLLPPSFAVQEARLRGRCSEEEEVIQRRLERTREELLVLPQYDYVVYNHDGGIDVCADDIRAIVRAEKCANKRHPNAAKAYFE
ncbi:MAG: guanylate kinase [Clostridia bacterium]|nr:guanylate kinase [Clostridia bacterium]